MSRDEYKYKRKAIAAAKQLQYGNDVVADLFNATTEAEIIRIMTNARMRKAKETQQRFKEGMVAR